MIIFKWKRLELQVARLGWGRNEYRDLVGKSEGKKQFGTPRGGLEIRINVDLKKNGTG